MGRTEDETGRATVALLRRVVNQTAVGSNGRNWHGEQMDTVRN